MKDSIKLRIKQVLWRVLDIILAFLPLIIYIITKWSKYFEVISETAKWKNIGSLLCMFLFLFILLIKKEILKGVLGMWIFVALFWALDFIIEDLFPLSLWATIGYTLSYFITKPICERFKRLSDATEVAEINNKLSSKNFDNVVNAINGRG